MPRAIRRLSARAAQSIDQPGYHADGDGLYLVVDAAGSRRWAYIYHRAGKRREMGLGRLSLKEAREAAEEARRTLRSGSDPIASRREARNRGAGLPTFQEAAKTVIADAKSRSTNSKVQYQWDLLLGERYCGPILQRRVHEITTLDVASLLGPVWREKPETGRKLLVRLRRVFDYARVLLRDRYGMAALGNPASWTDLRDVGFERNVTLSRGHQPALSYEQGPEFWMALQVESGLAARALELTLLTALRTSEVIKAEWREVDLSRGIFLISPERLKDRRTRTEPRRIPLSTQAVQVLSCLPRISSYVFPGQKPGSTMSNMAMLQLLKRMNRDNSGDPIWRDGKSRRPITAHGLRSTFRTWGDDVGHDRGLLEEALGHQVGGAVERAYRRTDSFERRRTVMQAWADYLSAQVPATSTKGA